MGQVPMAAARDGLFPPIFGALSERGVPAVGIVISAILTTVLVLTQVAGPPGFSASYNLRGWPQHHGRRHSLCLLCVSDGHSSRHMPQVAVQSRG